VKQQPPFDIKSKLVMHCTHEALSGETLCESPIGTLVNVSDALIERLQELTRELGKEDDVEDAKKFVDLAPCLPMTMFVLFMRHPLHKDRLCDDCVERLHALVTPEPALFTQAALTHDLLSAYSLMGDQLRVHGVGRRTLPYIVSFVVQFAIEYGSVDANEMRTLEERLLSKLKVMP
jgi:hypothetical protein